MRGTRAVISGIAGAVALTAVHEFGKRNIIAAPRVDKLGMQSIKKILGRKSPENKNLFRVAMASDLVSNSLYYSLVGLSSRPLLTGSLLGAGSGLGVVLLPDKLGLNNTYSARTGRTKLMSFSYYLIGGIVTGLMARMMRQ